MIRLKVDVLIYVKIIHNKENLTFEVPSMIYIN